MNKEIALKRGLLEDFQSRKIKLSEIDKVKEKGIWS